VEDRAEKSELEHQKKFYDEAIIEIKVLTNTKVQSP